LLSSLLSSLAVSSTSSTLLVWDGRSPVVAAIETFTGVCIFTGKDGGKKGRKRAKRKEIDREIERAKAEAEEAQADEGRRAKTKPTVVNSVMLTKKVV
jgi:hypothetical protein